MNDSNKHEHAVVPEASAGRRFDQVAAKLFPDYSRERLKQWIKEGVLTIDGHQLRPRDAVTAGAILQLDVEHAEASLPNTTISPEDLPIDVVFADASLLVINKPVGLVVHPGAGQHAGTLQNALLFHYPMLEKIPRAGIVHRLDKDTSGLMVV
ncbi:MAG: RNA pseudouridine synthase, partial [Gammaproteobacteria bacterium]|nr:RNA pseudouridine synthase [Gammaproteobacteria bacterium]